MRLAEAPPREGRADLFISPTLNLAVITEAHHRGSSPRLITKAHHGGPFSSVIKINDTKRGEKRREKNTILKCGPYRKPREEEEEEKEKKNMQRYPPHRIRKRRKNSRVCEGHVACAPC